jgi:hypothetical protein
LIILAPSAKPLSYSKYSDVALSCYFLVMDRRLAEIVSRQQEAGFPALAGSEVRATIRIAEQLLNEVLAKLMPAGAALSSVAVHPQAGNRFAVRLSLAKPSFLPPLTAGLVIERQPQVPADPVLVLGLTGGASVLRLAAPAITNRGVLPPFVRMEGSRLFVDIRALLKERGLAQLLDYAQDLRVTTDEGSVILDVAAGVRAET